jgi:2-polyprenyl-3-methyl-5-hydroxy-6-metoxy-1,4-benzoquinol methylase
MNNLPENQLFRDTNAIARYDRIDSAYLVDKKILELGCGNHGLQLQSKHKKIFLSKNYLGIDVDPPKNAMNVQKVDFFDVSFSKDSFDTIIVFEVLEHISFPDWIQLSNKIQRWIKPGGVALITTPYNEFPNHYDIIYPHLVFGIRKRTLQFHFPNMKVQMLQHSFLWGNSNENKIRRLLRGFKRIITRHPYNENSLYGIWQKEE